MADGNYLGELLAARREAPTPGIVTGMQQGLGLGQDIKAIPYNSALLNMGQQQITKQQATQKALDQYNKTGDIGPLKAIDPATAATSLKLGDYFKSRPSEHITAMTNALGQLKPLAPMITQKSWPEIRKQIMTSNPGLEENNLPADNATDQELYQFKNYFPLIEAQLKQAGQGPHAVNPGGSLVGPGGQELFRNPERMTTVLTPEGGVAGQVQGPVHVLPSPKEDKDTELKIVENALREKLGRNPTWGELQSGLVNYKSQVAGGTAAGKVTGTQEATAPGVAQMGDAILKGKATLAYVKNAFGDAQSNRVFDYVTQKDPGYNFIQADANAKWFVNPATQKLIRRTESIVAPGGPVDELKRFARLVDNPAGTKINQLKGDAAIQFGNSRTQLLRMVNSLSAEEQQQIFGAQGGGEKFLDLALGLNDTNRSVEQTINAADELRYLILTRQAANVRGTPEQEKWEGMAKKLRAKLPYMTPAELKLTEPSPEKPRGQGKQSFGTIQKDPQTGIDVNTLGSLKTAAQGGDQDAQQYLTRIGAQWQ